MKKDLQIPQDLRLLYEGMQTMHNYYTSVPTPIAYSQVINLIERIARLEEEIDTLKAQAPSAPTCSIIGSGIPSRYGHRTW